MASKTVKFGDWKNVLVDIETEEGATGRSYLFCYLRAAQPGLVSLFGEIERLMVWMPPGSAKSTYASVLFPPWFMGRNPGASVLGVSNTTELAERFSRRSGEPAGMNPRKGNKQQT